MGVWGYQIFFGLGVTGLRHPAFWGVYITNFVFWVGIAHSGTLISAVLFLFRAKFRSSFNRAAGAMTIFAVMTAGLFPMIHIGRIWKFWWFLPYPNQRSRPICLREIKVPGKKNHQNENCCSQGTGAHSGGCV
ncbi:MAG: polysulfide reductase NrfD [bacterium]|nr:polysulfide reductase NrfD [bacterium]